MADEMSEHDAAALSMVEANRLFTEAGWTPINKPCWNGGFVMARQVGGVSPNGNQYVKGLDIVRPDDPLYGPDYPDEHHEAAAWLIRMYPAPMADNPLSLDSLAPAPEVEETPAHEAHGETGGKDQKADGTSDSFSGIDAGMVDSAAPEEAIAGSGVEGSDAQGVAGGALDVPESQAQDDPGAAEQDSVGSGDGMVADQPAEDLEGADAGPASGGGEVLAHDGQAWPSDSEPEVDYEADFEEIESAAEVEGADALLELEPPSLGEEILEQQEQESPQGQDRFIGLDDLDRRRSLRIGDVTVAAATRMPNVDWPTLAELRNFAMGVSENRWPNDDAKQAALLELEGIASHRRQIEMLRDERVAFLLSASREEVEAFDPEAGWP